MVLYYVDASFITDSRIPGKGTYRQGTSLLLSFFLEINTHELSRCWLGISATGLSSV